VVWPAIPALVIDDPIEMETALDLAPGDFIGQGFQKSSVDYDDHSGKKFKKTF
jgi:hypothetical protein